MDVPVDVTRDAGVAVITLNDPARRNALTMAVVEGVIGAVDEAERDPHVHAIVIAAAPPAFCAGADLHDLIAAAHGDDANVERVYECFGRVADSPLPTIAAVGGAAVGAGFNLALACDLRIVSERARFESRFLGLGIHPGGAHVWMLSRLVGHQVAAAMLLAGLRLTGEEAVQYGLALEAVGGENLLTRALEVGATIATYPRELVLQTKRTIVEAGTTASRAAALAVETERQRDSLRDPAALSGLEAMLARITADR